MVPSAALISLALLIFSPASLALHRPHHHPDAKRMVKLAERSESSEVAVVERSPEPASSGGDPHLTQPWYVVDPYQQDHIRYHCYLSMACYGDPAKSCPKTFDGPGGFTFLGKFSTTEGQAGYMAIVPEMDKVVIVFGGYGDMNKLSWKLKPLTEVPSSACPGCAAAEGPLTLYRAAKKATNDFKIAKDAVKKTGHKFSVTGHGVGGAVAQIAAIDFGYRNLVHYSHSQGAPRVFNAAAVKLYDKLFQGESSQRSVNKNDFMVVLPPTSGGLTHAGTAVHLTGDKDQWLTNCYYNNENSTCLGTGKSQEDHKYYFTPLGQCGSKNKGF